MEYPEISALPDEEDMKNLAIASVVTGLAFSAFYQSFNFMSAVYLIIISAFILIVREVGVRLVVYKLDGYVDLKLSRPGSTATLVGAVASVATSLPLILLFPVSSEAERKRYENWGKSVDAIWAKYDFFISLGGVAALLLFSIAMLGRGPDQVAQMFALFALFQMMPFDYENIPTGKLDGADIIRWSGFYWLFLTGLSIVLVGLTL